VKRNSRKILVLSERLKVMLQFSANRSGLDANIRMATRRAIAREDEAIAKIDDNRRRHLVSIAAGQRLRRCCWWRLTGVAIRHIQRLLDTIFE
jgi:hypothetical protein